MLILRYSQERDVMSSEELAKLKEIEQMKDEQIAQLEKMKNVLKDKLTEAQKEIASLKSQIEDLKKENAAKPSMAAAPVKSESHDGGIEIKPEHATKINNSIAQLRMIVSDLEKLPLSSAQLASMGKSGRAMAQPQREPEAEYEEPVAQESQEFVRRKPSDVAKAQKPSQQSSSESTEQEFVRRKPSDVAKSQPEAPMKQAQPIAKQPAAPANFATESSANLAAAVQSNAGSQVKVLPYPADNIIMCPKCKSRSYAQVDNTEKIISFVPRKIYAKKYVCQMCKSEWEYTFN